MKRSALNKLDEFFLRDRPTVVFPPTRGFDAILFRYIKERIRKDNLTWKEAITEMAIDWLKKK